MAGGSRKKHYYKMKVTINNKEYNVDFQGTIGILVYTSDYVEKFGGNVSAQMLEQLTFYAAFVLSNETADPLPTFIQFVNHWQKDELQAFRKWFDEKWEQLDPKPKPKKTNEGGKKTKKA